MPQSFQSQQVRVFISSTFRDMQVERDVLVKQVFPELRRRCTERGVDFVEVDLRWGVTEAEAENGEVLPICLQEIELCRPYFIGLLGERYGWVPSQLPGELVEEQAWLDGHRDKSLTELEILHGVLNNPDTAGRAFFYFRDPGYAKEHGGDHAAEDTAASQKLADLKARIRAGATSVREVRENYANPEALGQHVLEDLWAAIDQEHPEEAKLSPLQQEARNHESFGESRQRVYVGREADLQRLDDHAAQGEGPPLVVHGESGCGKTALVANWLARYRRANPKARTFVHYLGSTADSADPWQMIRRLLQTLKEWGTWEEDIPAEREELEEKLPLALATAGHSEPVVIVIDGLNQVLADGRDLRWLPWHTPPGVRLVLSVIPGECLDLLQQREWPMQEVPLLSADHQREVAAQYLGRFRKKLPEELLDEVVAAPPTANPLYLKVLLDELRVFGEHEQLAQKLRWYLEAATPDALYERMLTRLEEDYEGKRTGLVSEALSLIWASRNGLSENELLELLGGDDQPALPWTTWAPLHLALQESLALRGGRLTFFHDYLRQAVEKRYVPAPATRQPLHLRLAKYFGEGDGDEVTERMAEELPWQLTEAKAWHELQPWLLNIDMFRLLYDRDWLELWGYWRGIIDATDEMPDLGLEYRQALDAWRKDLGSSMTDKSVRDEAYLYVLDRVQGFLKDVGDARAAEPFAKESLDLAIKQLGPEHPNVATSYNNIGFVHNNKGEYDKALEHYQKALAIFLKQLGPEHPDVAISYNNIGGVHDEKGEYDKALEHFQKSLAIDLKKLGPEHPHVAMSYNNIGGVHRKKGEYDKALEHYQKSLAINLKKLGPEHPYVAMSYGNIGMVHDQKGEYDKALEHYQKSLAIVLKQLGPEHPDVAMSYNNIGEVHRKKGEYDKALEYYQKSLAIRLKQLGPEHPDVARSYNNIGMVHDNKGEYDKALEYYQKSLAIVLKKLGPEHPHVGASYHNIGLVHDNKGDYDKALEHYQKALDIFSEQLGPDHPYTTQTLEYVSLLKEQLGEDD